jgi:hypothetical protein
MLGMVISRSLRHTRYACCPRLSASCTGSSSESRHGQREPEVEKQWADTEKNITEDLDICLKGEKE